MPARRPGATATHTTSPTQVPDASSAGRRMWGFTRAAAAGLDTAPGLCVRYANGMISRNAAANRSRTRPSGGTWGEARAAERTPGGDRLLRSGTEKEAGRARRTAAARCGSSPETRPSRGTVKALCLVVWFRQRSLRLLLVPVEFVLPPHPDRPADGETPSESAVATAAVVLSGGLWVSCFRYSAEGRWSCLSPGGRTSVEGAAPAGQAVAATWRWSTLFASAAHAQGDDRDKEPEGTEGRVSGEGGQAARRRGGHGSDGGTGEDGLSAADDHGPLGADGAPAVGSLRQAGSLQQTGPRRRTREGPYRWWRRQR